MQAPLRASLPRRLILALAFATALGACGGSKPQAASPAAKPKPLNAASLARSLADGKVELTIHVERIKDHPAASQIAALEPVSAPFEGTGVDVLKDIERVYAAGPSAREEQKFVVVARHKLSRAQVDRAMTSLLESSSPPGRRLEKPFPAVLVSKRGHPRVVAEPEPGYLVILPPDKEPEAARFVGTGGFEEAPPKVGAELLSVDPHATLQAPGAPRAPEGLRKLRADVFPREDGGADVAIEGQSASAEQAPADAEAMTDAISRATSRKIAFVTVRFFREIPFKAEGDKVRGEVNLSSDEVGQIVSLASALR